MPVNSLGGAGIILATDQAACSGWALGHDRGITHPMKVLGFGYAQTAKERQAIVMMAAQYRDTEGVPLRYVYEDHTSIPVSSTDKTGEHRSYGAKTLLGMGRAEGRWLEQLELIAGIESGDKALVRGVDKPSWVRTVLGPMWARAKGDLSKEQALRIASALVGQIKPDNDSDAAHARVLDTAEAICMLMHAPKLFGSGRGRGMGYGQERPRGRLYAGG